MLARYTAGRTERLFRLMSDHRLRIKDVAKLLGVREGTVRGWRTVFGRDIPPQMLERLETIIEERARSGGKVP